MNELKALIQNIQNDLKTKATDEKINELIRKIDEKDVKIAKLEEKVGALEGRLSIVENTNAQLVRKCDDLESYTRRQNLRIVGIPEAGREDGEACLQKVKEEIGKLGLHLDLDKAIDRAHRVGPSKDRQGNPVERPMIVRFSTWRARTHVYTNRRKEDGHAKFYIDLTKRRFDLKKVAQQKTQGNPKVKFAYADVNNNVCLRLADDSKKIFNSVEELDQILARV